MAFTPGSGSTIKVTITATPTTILQITSIGAVTRTRAMIDFSALNDTQEQMLASVLKRSDVLTVKGWLDCSTATHAYLETSYSAGTTEVWLITYADTNAATLGFSGFLTKLSYGPAEVDGGVAVEIDIKLTTIVTVTP